MVMIYEMGALSGAHFNLSVTLGFWAARCSESLLVALHLFSQTTGAIASSAALKLMLPQDHTLGGTIFNGLSTQSFVLKMILTAILLFVIWAFQAARKKKVSRRALLLKPLSLWKRCSLARLVALRWIRRACFRALARSVFDAKWQFMD